MLLNSVSKLCLFRAFNDPVFLCVDVKAVVEPFGKENTGLVSSDISRTLNTISNGISIIQTEHLDSVVNVCAEPQHLA